MKSKLLCLAIVISNITLAQLKVLSGTQVSLADGGILYTNEHVKNNGTISLNSGRLLVSGNFINSSTLNASNATIEIVGGNTQSFTFANNDIVKRLELKKTGNSASVLSGILNITDAFKSVSGNLDAAEKIVFRSTSAKTAIVEQSISGTVDNMVVERYIPARSAYRLLSSPVTSTTSIKYNWQENQNNTSTVFANNSNTAAGYGTHITGSATGANGFDATSSGNPSLFQFNNNNQTWNSVTNTDTNTLSVGSAYRLLVQGDRSVDISTNTPTPTTTVLRTRGTLKIGDHTVTGLNTNADTYNLIGNPYQNVVDFKTVLVNSTNVNPNYYYVWDPKIGGANGKGGYVAYSFLTNSNNVNGSVVDGYLQPMQACFVKTLANGAPNLVFQESNKNPGNGQNTNSTVPVLQLNLYDAVSLAQGETALDGTMLLFGNQFSDGSDAYDAGKLLNTDENLSVVVNNNQYSIGTFNMPINSTVYPLNLTNLNYQNYSFKAKLENYSGPTPYLLDQYLGTTTPIVNGTTYAFSINSNQSLSSDPSRFKIVFQQATLGVSNNELNKRVNVYPNPSKIGTFYCNYPSDFKEVKVELFNQLGQSIEIEQFKIGNNQIQCTTKSTVQSGVYYIKISNNNETSIIKKWIVN